MQGLTGSASTWMDDHGEVERDVNRRSSEAAGTEELDSVVAHVAPVLGGGVEDVEEGVVVACA